MKDKIIIALALISIGALLYFGFFGQASIMSIGSLPWQEKAFTFDGISGTAKSPIFGSATNTRGVLGTKGDPFCGNDGDVAISNQLDDGSSLIMVSYIKASRRACGTNGIESNFDVPSGKLSGRCIAEGYSSSCEVNGKNYGTENFEIVFNEPGQVKALTLASAKEGESIDAESRAELKLDFQKSQVQQPAPAEETQQPIPTENQPEQTYSATEEQIKNITYIKPIDKILWSIINFFRNLFK